MAPCKPTKVTIPVSPGIVAAVLSSGGVESLGWLNDLLSQLWPCASVAIAALTKEIVEPLFAEALPGPLKTLHFSKLDFGNVPPKLDKVDVHTLSDDKFTKLDLDVTWEGKCDIDLEADVCPGIGCLSLGVESIQLKGRLSVVIGPLIDCMPVVSAITLAFINPPEVSLDFTGVANIADFKGVKGIVRGIVDSVIANLMVLPARMLIKLDPKTNCIRAHRHPMGACCIKAVKGAGFKVQGRMMGKDIPDVYLVIKFGTGTSTETVWKTKHVTNSTDPVFDEDELRHFLLSDHDQRVFVEAWDEDGIVSGDDYLGGGSVTIGEMLVADGRTVDVTLHNKKGRAKHFIEGCTVTLKCDAFPMTTNLASLDLNLNFRGVLTVLVAGVTNLPVEREKALSRVEVKFGKQTLSTLSIADVPSVDGYPAIDGLNPAYDATFLIHLDSDGVKALSNAPVIFSLKNGKDDLGMASVEYAELLAAAAECGDPSVTRKVDVGGGAIMEFCVSLRGIQISS